LFSWPLPIGNFGMEVYELLINELYFQGVSIMNELRKTFFLDLIDPSKTIVETRYFNSVLFIYSPEEEKFKEIEKGGDEKDKQDLNTILNYLCDLNSKYEEVSFREFMVKIFLTVVSKYIFINNRKLK
jgi:hypothetical protein